MMTHPKHTDLAERLVRDYGFMGALRGPDSNQPIARALKRIYTARIRAFVEPILRPTCHGVVISGPIVADDLECLIRGVEQSRVSLESLESFEHYLSHIEDALLAIDKHNEHIIHLTWPTYKFHSPLKLMEVFVTRDCYDLHQAYRMLSDKERT